MEFIKFVEQIPNITIAKRIASAYVADYRRLELDEIKEFLIKTAKQYTSYENISNRLEELKLDGNRAVRIIAPILLRDYLLDQDDFISSCKEKRRCQQTPSFKSFNYSPTIALTASAISGTWQFA